MIAIVILRRVLEKMLQWRKQVIKCKEFYQLVSDRERALPPSTEKSELTFVVKKSTMMLSGVSIFKE